MKLITPQRPNYSRYAKLCDQTFYHDSQPNSQAPSGYQTAPLKPEAIMQSTYGFSSIPRSKRGNFRFAIRLPYGQFTQKPNHAYGKSKSPSWSFSKEQKYQNQKFVEYQMCPKNLLIKKDSEELRMKSSTTSMKQFVKDKVKFSKTSSFASTKAQSVVHETYRNYSIVSPRETSPVNFYCKSKISKPVYVSKQDLMNAEGKIESERYIKELEPNPQCYQTFYKKTGRRPNLNVKGFETFNYSYSHEKQFNNYSENKHPLNPQYHIDFEKHLDRPDYTPNKLGPNTQTYEIDAARISHANINLKLCTFRDAVTTRYDRVEPEPNTKLDYDQPVPELGGFVVFEKVLDRLDQLFPIVDPIIKKAGDEEMKAELKRCVFSFEFNEAHRPKNVENRENYRLTNSK